MRKIGFRGVDNAKSRRSALSRRRYGEREMKMERDESERVCVYMCVHVCTKGVPKGSRGLEAQFCSVNPWRRARGVYHSASEFVVPRLVTNKSVFRTQPRALLSHPATRSILLSTLPPHSRLFTCITFAEDTRKTLTRFCAFKVVPQKPGAIRGAPKKFDLSDGDIPHFKKQI